MTAARRPGCGGEDAAIVAGVSCRRPPARRPGRAEPQRRPDQAQLCPDPAEVRRVGVRPRPAETRPEVARVRPEVAEAHLERVRRRPAAVRPAPGPGWRDHRRLATTGPGQGAR